MKNLFVTYATDAITKYQIRIGVGALASALWDSSRRGVPMCVSHDLLRPIGWNRPAALHIEPGMARLVGFTLLSETTSEHSQLKSVMEEYLNERLVAEYEDELAALRTCLQPYLDGSEVAATLECAALCGAGLAERVFPALFADRDGDGLVFMDRLSAVGPGVYKIGELVLFAHPFFRRSLSRLNNLNFPFLERLQQVRDRDMSVRVALDSDMIGLASSYKLTPIEFEYWRGPKFDDDLPAIRPGVAHHEADARQRFYHQVSGTQFWWHTKDGVHTLEAEEIRDGPTEPCGDVTYGCRYVHARVATDTGVIDHFDGAIRGYTDEHMIDRLGVDIMHAGRHSVYTKLWRVDGKVPHALWKELLTDYYRDNPLVGEYLTGALDDPLEEQVVGSQDKRDIPVPVAGREEWSRERLVPFLMVPGDGVRLAVSFHPRREQEGNASRTVLAQEMIQVDDRVVPVVSDEILELKKALERIGETLDLSPNLHWLLYEDLHIDMPAVYHIEAGLPDSLYRTLSGLQSLVDAWIRQGHNRVIAFRVSFPIEDRDVVLSVMGSVTDVSAWLSRPEARPPTDREGLKRWLDSEADHMREAYPPAEDHPALKDTLTSTGELGLQRLPVTEFPYQFVWSDAENALMFEAQVNEELGHLVEKMNVGVIQAGTAHVAEELLCRQCNVPYVTCGCSRVLDAKVSVEVARLRSSFLFWTNEKA